jgi:hypothetical protein
MLFFTAINAVNKSKYKLEGLINSVFGYLHCPRPALFKLLGPSLARQETIYAKNELIKADRPLSPKSAVD